MPSYGPNDFISSSKPLLIDLCENIILENDYQKLTFTGVIDTSNTTIQIQIPVNSLNCSLNFMVIGGGGGGGGFSPKDISNAGSGGGGGANLLIQYPVISSFNVDTVGNGGAGQTASSFASDGTATKLSIGNDFFICDGGKRGETSASSDEPVGGKGGSYTFTGATEVVGGVGGDGGNGSNKFPSPGYLPPTSGNIPEIYKGKSSQFGIDTGYTGTYKIPLLNNSDNSNFIYGGCGGGGGGGYGPITGTPEQSSGGIPGGGNVSPSGVYFPYTYIADGLINGVGRGIPANVYGGGGSGNSGSDSVSGEGGGNGKQGVVVFWFVMLIAPPPTSGCDWNPLLQEQTTIWSRADGDCIGVNGEFLPDGSPMTREDLSEKRKAVIFQYKNNSAGFSKKQQFSRLARGLGKPRGKTYATQGYNVTNPNVQNLPLVGKNVPTVVEDGTGNFVTQDVFMGTTLVCTGANEISGLTTQNDTPGPTRTITNYPTVPLTNYIVRRTYKGGSEKWPQYGPNTGQPRLPKYARNTGTKPGMNFWRPGSS